MFLDQNIVCNKVAQQIALGCRADCYYLPLTNANKHVRTPEEAHKPQQLKKKKISTAHSYKSRGAFIVVT